MAKVKAWVERPAKWSPDVTSGMWNDLGAVTFEYTPVLKADPTEWIDNTGKKHNAPAATKKITVPVGPDLYDFLYNTLPKELYGNKQYSEINWPEARPPEEGPREKFKWDRAMPPLTQERRSLTDLPKLRRLWDTSEYPDIEFESTVNPNGALTKRAQQTAKVLGNILNSSRDFTPLFGRTDDVPSDFVPFVRYPADWPDEETAGKVFYGINAVKEARHAGVKDDEENGIKAYGQMPVYRNIEHPLLNFNDTMWSTKSLDEIRSNMGSMPAYLASYPFGEQTRKKIDDIDYGVTPAYADYEGNLVLDEAGMPKRFDYLADTHRRYNRSNRRYNRSNIRLKEGLTSAAKQQEIDVFTDRLAESYMKDPDTAIRAAVAQGDDEVAAALKHNKEYLVGMNGNSGLPEDMFAKSLFGVTRSDVGDLRAINKEDIYTRLLNPETGLPIGDVYTRPIKQYTEATRLKDRMRDDAAKVNQLVDYLEMSPEAQAKSEASKEAMIKRLRDEKPENVVSQNKGGYVTSSNPATIRKNGLTWFKNLLKDREGAAPEQIRAAKMLKNSGVDPEALRTYFFGPGDGKPTKYQDFKLYELPPEQRIEKMLQLYNGVTRNNDRQSAILAGLGVNR